jgi:tetratricopeptide (TPR) repeat protein
MARALAIWTAFLMMAAAATPARAAAGVSESAHREALEHYRAGQSFMYAESWPEAEREFRAAIGLDPQLVLAHFSLGQTCMSMKEYPKAVIAFKGARSAFLEGASLAMTDRVKADQRRDEEIRELRDGVRTIRSQASALRQSSQQPENMILKLESRIKELETYKFTGGGALDVPAEFSLALGSAYFRTGALADAQREYEAALKVRPNFGEAHNNLAVVYMLQGKLAEADVQLKAAEKAGFHVNPQLKVDLAKRKGS